MESDHGQCETNVLTRVRCVHARVTRPTDWTVGLLLGRQRRHRRSPVPSYRLFHTLTVLTRRLHVYAAKKRPVAHPDVSDSPRTRNALGAKLRRTYPSWVFAERTSGRRLSTPLSPSCLSTTAAAAHPYKTVPFLRARDTDERLTRHLQSLIYIRRFAGCPRTGSAVQDVHVTLGSEP